MSDLDLVRTLIQDIKYDYPKLYQALGILLESVDSLIIDNRTITETLDITAIIVESPTGFTYILRPRSIGFSWAIVVGAIFYEIREGIVWESGSLIARVGNINVEVIPRLAGTYNFMLKSMNAEFAYSESTSNLIVVIPNIPALAVVASVIDNNVLLDWNEPNHPFEIIEYKIFRNGIQIGYVDSSFFLYFEMLGGSYTYGIQAVDIAGNESPIATTTVTVSQPPDYVMEDSFVSDLLGEYVNVYPMTE